MDNFRGRYKASGAKIDSSGAFVLVNILRTDRPDLRKISKQSELTEKISILVLDREKLVHEKVRLENQLSGCLREYFPIGLEVRKQGIECIMEQALEKAGDVTNTIYLSIDIDCLDQSFAPGVSAPSPAGLTSWDVLHAAFMAGKHPLVKGIDIVEISPPLDVNNLTSNIGGATIILYFLGGLNERTQV